MSYAVRNDGLGWRAVSSMDDVGPEETFSAYPPPELPAKHQAEKDEILTQARAVREQILNRLSGILLSYLVAGDTSHNSAIETARQGLLNMTKDPRVVAATDGDSTKCAVMSVYGEIAAALAAADPASVSAFNGISL